MMKLHMSDEQFEEMIRRSAQADIRDGVHADESTPLCPQCGGYGTDITNTGEDRETFICRLDGTTWKGRKLY